MARLTSIISLRDNYSGVMKRAAFETRKFRNDVETVRKAMDAAYKRERQVRINTSAGVRAVKNLIRTMQPIRDKTVQIVARTQHFMGRMKPVTDRLTWIGKAPFTVALKLRDGVSSGLSKIRGALSGLAKGVTIAATITGGIGLGAGGMIKSGMDLENQMVSMEHFIGAYNKGLSGDQVKATAQQYLSQLRQNANATPFETGEVISAGTRALSIASGDTGMAMQMLKLAEDMAALTPGKTLSDAMEALADAQMGEMERLKEFGFKGSKELFDAAGGNIMTMKSASGMSLTEMFSGGSEKLSQTGSGMINTIKGSLKSGLQDAGFTMLEELKPGLEKLIPLVDQMKPVFMRFGNFMASGISKGIALIEKNKGTISGIITTFRNVFSIVSSIVGQFVNFIKPLIPPIVGIFASVVDWFVANMPVFQNSIGAVFQFLAPVIQAVINVVKFLWDVWVAIFPTLASILETVWKVLGPIFSAIVSILQIIILVAKKLWAILKPILEFIWKLLKPIVEGIGKVASWIGDGINGINWIKDKIVGSDEKGKPHAAGLSYVPYDNYPALLHKGERVLTRTEADQFRKSLRGGLPNIIIHINGVEKGAKEIAREVINELVRELDLVTINTPSLTSL